VLGGDAVTLNTTNAKGVFSSKAVGTGKAVTISGLALAGANAGNYKLTQPSATGSITARSLTVTAKGVNKVYDSTTNATVTLADNKISGDAITDSYSKASFTNKNVGTAIAINVSGISIAGTDAGNYQLTNTTATTSANITKATLTVSGIIASNKVYDGTTTAVLVTSNATLATVFGTDKVTLNATNAKGVFSSKTVGTGKTVTISGLTIIGTDSTNYSLTQPTATASITARTLTVAAKGVNKVYDGTTNATVTLTDNRVTGDSLTNTYASAAFASKNVATNITVNVTGISTGGTDSTNYVLAATSATTSANITKSLLTVTADSLSRPYGMTNPALTATFTGFVIGESVSNSDVVGSPAFTTTANSNSVVGTYPITITIGTLASTNYSFSFSSGVLTVTKADTSAFVSTTLNPALTNQNITFGAAISSAASGLKATGVVQFKWNGTNKIGSAITLSSGTANVTVLAATLGYSNAVITAEYSDPSGNYNPSTNSLTQNISAPATTTAPPKMSLAPSAKNGFVTAYLSGVSNVTYVIEASTDLVHWSPISTNVADGSGNVSLVDSNSAAYPSRFYRSHTQ